MSRSQFVTTLAVSATFFVTALAGASGTFHNLGSGMTVSGVSANGSVAVGTNGAGYFYWTQQTGVVQIGGVPPSSGGGQAKVSDDGSLICGTLLNPISGNTEMGIYSIPNAAWTPLGGIGAPCSTELSSGWGISGDGSTVVGLGWLTCSPAHAIRWNTKESTVDMGSTVANRSTRANSVNTDGSVIVGWQDGSTGFRQGAMWVNGAQTLIYADGAQTLPLSEAGDVSSDGQWVVCNGASTNGFQAWRWNASTGTANGAESFGAWPANPSWRGSSTAISADASKIVGYYRPFPGPATFGQGFLWTEASGLHNLTTLAADSGISTGGVTLALPLDISADGNTVVGLGFGGVGFIITIDPQVDCPADIDGSGSVDVDDLITVILAWGVCGDPQNCPADTDGNGSVDVDDLIAVILAWGACP